MKELEQAQKFEIVDFRTMQNSISENFEGLSPQFISVKVPSGDISSFEIDDEPIKYVEGIIVDHYAIRFLFMSKYGGSEKVPPLCRSIDGVYGQRTGVDKPIQCANCEYNAWGSYAEHIDSSDHGNRKACQEKHRLFLLRSGELLPIVFTLPATSIQPLAFYMTKLASRGRHYSTVVTKIGLEKTKSRGGIDFVKTTFQKVIEVPNENVEETMNVAKYLKSYCRQKPIEPTEEESDDVAL